MTEKPVSDAVSARLTELRKKRGWSMAQLAERCVLLGAPQITVDALENLEYGRKQKDGTRKKRAVTVDDWLILALALDVAPVHLLVPPTHDQSYPLSKWGEASTDVVRAWIRGVVPLDVPWAPLEPDAREYYSEVPKGEFYSPGSVDRHASQQGPARTEGES